MGKRGPQPGTVKKPEGSGRKAGTLNKATAEVKELAGKYGPKAIEGLAKLAGLAKNEVGKAESEAARVAAMKEILDRAYGKSAQPVGGGDGTEPIKHLFGWLPSDG